MPVQQLPTTNYTNYDTGLGRFPGYSRENDTMFQHLSSVGLQGRKTLADQQAQASDQTFQRGMQQAELGNRTQLTRMQNRGENRRAQIAANASMYPAQLQQERFNTLLPLLQGALGGQSQYSVGGQSQQGPAISSRPVWDDSQVNQRVNLMAAQNSQKAASQMNAAQQQAAGNGFGSRSPLLAELNARYQGQAMANTTRGENDLRWNAAQGNAQQVLAAQQAQEQQVANRNQEDIERRKTWSGYQSSLLGALAGLM